MGKITFDVKTSPPSEWYGSLELSNFQLDGKPLIVNNWLVASFSVPTKDSTSVDTSANFGPAPASYVNTKEVDKMIQVTVYFQFSSSFTFKPENTLNFDVNGDMRNPSEVVKTISLTNDPSGTVNIQFVDVPQELVGNVQGLTFTDGNLVVPITLKAGSPFSFAIVPSTFTVTAGELTNGDQTIVSTPQVSPSTISVENGKATVLKVIYNGVKPYCTIDVTIGDISPLQEAQFFGTVTSSGTKLRDFTSPANNIVTLYRLPPSGTLDFGINTITLNNFPYSFTTQSVNASAKPHQAVTFDKATKGPSIIPPDSVKLPIVVNTKLALEATFTVRITLLPANYNYTQQVKAVTGTTDFSVLVAPGTYTVQVSGFINDYTVYFPKAPSTLNVEKDGTTKLTLEFITGPSLKVPGFPNFLSFGGCSTGVTKEEADFKTARASSVFKYAGLGGNGDPTLYLEEDLATIKNIKFSNDVGKDLKQPVLPVMVSYTCDLSGGDMKNLSNPEKLAFSFGNLIVSLINANTTMKGLDKPSQVVGIGYVINPDFLGMCQQHKIATNFSMEVRKSLTEALKWWKISLEVPTTIPDTLSGYVLAVNWLMRTIPLTLKFEFVVTFGWQVNIWGGGSALWIYGDEDPATAAQSTVDYIKSLSVYDGPYRPDYLAVDRFEEDDFVFASGPFRFGPHEWPRYIDYCKALSISLTLPLMLWQIPSSYTPLTSDTVNTNFDAEYFGTGGSYFLGDIGLGSNYHNVNPIMLSMPFDQPQLPYKTVKDLFTRQPFNWSQPAYVNLPLYGIFGMLLGGGEITGIVSDIGNSAPFTRERLHAYMNNPISTDNFNT